MGASSRGVESMPWLWSSPVSHPVELYQAGDTETIYPSQPGLQYEQNHYDQ